MFQKLQLSTKYYLKHNLQSGNKYHSRNPLANHTASYIPKNVLQEMTNVNGLFDLLFKCAGIPILKCCELTKLINAHLMLYDTPR
jgi:hypothetical protein